MKREDNLSLFFNKKNMFRRSKYDKILGGVCGGLAELTGINAWFWRILMIVISGSVWLYLILWIFTKED
jgi:phage shock protein PspC (stress-responsive transcriptional regulator)